MAETGRPSKYSEDTPSKAKEYLDNFAECGDVVPSIAGLAVHLKIARRTVHAWVKEEGKEEFSHIVEEIMSAQERTLFNKGLTSDFNASIVKLGLTKHGYTDKADNTISGPDGKPIQTESSFNFIPVDSSS